MPRLTPVKRRVLIAVLRRNGLEHLPGRGKGGHAVYAHPNEPVRWTVVPDTEEVAPRLLSQIITQAGKSRDEYQQRLREV